MLHCSRIKTKKKKKEKSVVAVVYLQFCSCSTHRRDKNRFLSFLGSGLACWCGYAPANIVRLLPLETHILSLYLSLPSFAWGCAVRRLDNRYSTVQPEAYPPFVIIRVQDPPHAWRLNRNPLLRTHTLTLPHGAILDLRAPVTLGLCLFQSQPLPLSIVSSYYLRGGLFLRICFPRDERRETLPSCTSPHQVDQPIPSPINVFDCPQDCLAPGSGTEIHIASKPGPPPDCLIVSFVAEYPTGIHLPRPPTPRNSIRPTGRSPLYRDEVPVGPLHMSWGLFASPAACAQRIQISREI